MEYPPARLPPSPGVSRNHEISSTQGEPKALSRLNYERPNPAMVTPPSLLRLARRCASQTISSSHQKRPALSSQKAMNVSRLLYRYVSPPFLPKSTFQRTPAVPQTSAILHPAGTVGQQPRRPPLQTEGPIPHPRWARHNPRPKKTAQTDSSTKSR